VAAGSVPDMGWNEQRESFGAVAETYDSYRPDWPAATAAWLTGTEDGGPLDSETEDGGTEDGDSEAGGAEHGGPLVVRARQGLDVLDLGAGTGKLTRTLVNAGHRVSAVDPSERMLSVLSAALPQVRALVATAEALPLAANSIDVVTVAQAWHWLKQPIAAQECARVLRPGGLLAVGWHLRNLAEPWVQELEDLTGEPEYLAGSVRSSSSGTLELPPTFGKLQSTTFDYTLQLTPQSLAALASSWSYVAIRPDRGKVLADVEALGRRVAGPDGVVRLPHVTRCYRAAREPDAGDPS
jgi:ubiquinone/menaquinone biosynthesis C-methylase UbiE